MSLQCHASDHNDPSDSDSLAIVNDGGDEDNTRCGGAAAADADATGEDSSVRPENPLSRGGGRREGETENAETDEHELVTGPFLGVGEISLADLAKLRSLPSYEDWTKPDNRVRLYSAINGTTEYCLADFCCESNPGIPGHWDVSEILSPYSGNWVKRESDSSRWVPVDPNTGVPQKIILLNGVVYDIDTGKHASLGKAGKTAQVVITGAAPRSPVGIIGGGVSNLDVLVNFAANGYSFNPEGTSAFQQIVESEAKRRKLN